VVDVAVLEGALVEFMVDCSVVVVDGVLEAVVVEVVLTEI